MSVSTVHVLHGIHNGSTFLSQIAGATPVTNLEEILGEPTGFPYPIFTAVLGSNPALPFECEQVKSILDLTGALTSIVDLSGNNTDLLYKKTQDLGRRVADGNSAHKRLRMSQAFLSLDRISAGHRARAVASCRLGTTFDGTNAPLVPAGSVALSGTPTAAEHFVAGPVFINTGSGLVQLPGIQDTTIEFERVIVEVGGDGELYNTHAHCAILRPVVVVRCLEFAWDTYGLNGSSFSACSVYLRKKARTPVADNTAEHIKFANSVGGLVSIQDTAAAGNDPAMTAVRLRLLGDASTEPITVNTAIAITT